MKSRNVRFKGSLSEQLAAKVDLPDDEQPRAFALFAHCFTCSKDFKAVVNIAKALTADGIAVMRFDFTGLGQSEGEFEHTNFSSNVDDLLTAVRYMEDNLKPPKILIGHSLGGAAVIQAADDVKSCGAVVVIGSPYDPAHVKQIFQDRQDEIDEKGEAEVMIAGRSFTITRQFVEDLKDEGLKPHLQRLRRPLLIFHSPIDNVVGIDNAAKIFSAAKHPKSFISLDEADHVLSDEKDSQYVGAMTAEWVTRYW